MNRMSVTNCPECQKEILDYRQDDPYCDCGWQLNQVESTPDELGWIIAVLAAVVTCGLQIVVLFILHLVSSYSISLLANLMAQHLTLDVLHFWHWIIILSIDLFVLGALFFTIGYFISRKSSYPILLTSIFAFIIVSFKFFVVDPYSNILYPMYGYIVNLLLLIITILSGFAAKYKTTIKKILFDK